MAKNSINIIFYLQFVLFSSCSNHLIISPFGFSKEISYQENIESVRFDEQEDLEDNSNKNLQSKVRVWSLLGGVFKGDVRLGREIRKKNKSQVPMEDLTITTTYTWSDVVLGFIPLATPRTIIYSGNYKE